MSSAIKGLKKENQELKKAIEKINEEKVEIAKRVDEAYADRMIDLEERVDEYKNILVIARLIQGRKDQQITGEIEQKEKIKAILK